MSTYTYKTVDMHASIRANLSSMTYSLWKNCGIRTWVSRYLVFNLTLTVLHLIRLFLKLQVFFLHSQTTSSRTTTTSTTTTTTTTPPWARATRPGVLCLPHPATSGTSPGGPPSATAWGKSPCWTSSSRGLSRPTTTTTTRVGTTTTTRASRPKTRLRRSCLRYGVELVVLVCQWCIEGGSSTWFLAVSCPRTNFEAWPEPVAAVARMRLP